MRDPAAYQKRVISALNPSVRNSPNIALGLRRVDSPSKVYHQKLLKHAKRNLKLIQAKQHYNNMSFFSTAFKRYKHIERERRSIEEQKNSEKLAKRIMKKTGKSAETLFTCSTGLFKEPARKRKLGVKKVRLVSDKDTDTDGDEPAAKSGSSSKDGKKSKKSNTTKSTKNEDTKSKEEVISKINFQDAKNSKQKPTMVYHAKVDEKSKSNNAVEASQANKVKVIKLPTLAVKPSAAKTKITEKEEDKGKEKEKEKEKKKSNGGPKVKGILKNSSKLSQKFGY